MYAWIEFAPCDCYIESANYASGEDSIATGEFGDGARIIGYESDTDNLIAITALYGEANCGEATQALDDAVMDYIYIDLWWDIDQDGTADADDAGNGGWIRICTLDPDGGADTTVGLGAGEGDFFAQCADYNLHLGRGWYLFRVHACNIYGFCSSTYATTYISGDGTGDWDDDEVVNFNLNRKPEPFEWE